MLLDTPICHFHEDINRAQNLLIHAQQISNDVLKDDVLRAACMLAVGSLDAFFCDAYADLLSRTYRAKIHQPEIELTTKMKNLKLPAIIFLEKNPNSGWLWRNVANDLVEKDNVLSINKIKTLFNHYFRKDHKLFVDTGTSIDRWINSNNYRQRIFRIDKKLYKDSVGKTKNIIKQEALKHLEERFSKIFQRRHDCIHNCDRPKYTLNRISKTYLEKVIEDIILLVNFCYDELKNEFPLYLKQCGFNKSTLNFVGA